MVFSNNRFRNDIQSSFRGSDTDYEPNRIAALIDRIAATSIGESDRLSKVDRDPVFSLDDDDWPLTSPTGDFGAARFEERPSFDGRPIKFYEPAERKFEPRSPGNFTRFVNLLNLVERASYGPLDGPPPPPLPPELPSQPEETQTAGRRRDFYYGQAPSVYAQIMLIRRANLEREIRELSPHHPVLHRIEAHNHVPSRREIQRLEAVLARLRARRVQNFYNYPTRKRAKDARPRPRPKPPGQGQTTRQGKNKDATGNRPEGHGKGSSHFHDHMHGRKGKPNNHYGFPPYY